MNSNINDDVLNKDQDTDQDHCPLLDEDHDRPLGYFPIKYQDVYDHYVKQSSHHWNSDELKLAGDRESFMSMTPYEQNVLKAPLAFFSQGDGLVVKNNLDNFSKLINMPEAKLNIGWQTMIENEHSISYAKMIQSIIVDPKECLDMLNSIKTNPAVKEKSAWAEQWLAEDIPMSKRLFGWACVEGIMFASSFAIIFWFRDKNKVSGICQGNELILRDECFHVITGSLFYKYLRDKATEEELQEIARGAVEAEHKFIDDTITQELNGLTRDGLKRYVQSCADAVLDLFGCSPIYKTSHPLEYMNSLNMLRKTNFFDKKNASYQLVGVETEIESGTLNFDSDTDDD